MISIECPYCTAKNKVRHDHEAGYEEDTKHEMQCRECDKYFVFTTEISFSYYPEKADCLNGSPHVLELTKTYPPEAARMQCKNCEHSEQKATP